MRIFVPILIGIFTALIVIDTTDYSVADWQWWVLSLAIIIPLNLIFSFFCYLDDTKKIK